ncbi:MAG: hypothetical protein QOD53_675 [Thermoleophilaceae bacterium]|nr:hypothetical protein [Thermoleophilaceae bacterium]
MRGVSGREFWRRLFVSWLALIVVAVVCVLLGVGKFVSILLILVAAFAFWIPPAVRSLPPGKRRGYYAALGVGLAPSICVAWAVTHPHHAVPALFAGLLLFLVPSVVSTVRLVRRSRRR